MSASFELNAEVRNDKGTGASRRLRHAGKVPAILYGGGIEPESLSLDHLKLMHSLENEAFYSHILTVNVDGKKQKAILRDLQRHPAKPRILHADFMRVSETEKIRVQVPLHFTGEDIAPGVKTGGGIVSHDMNDMSIECLPKHLPEFVEVDISALDIGDSLHLEDLALPEGVESPDIARGQNPVVVSIHARKAEEVDEVVAAADETAEGEVPAEGDAGAGDAEAGDEDKS